MGMISIRSPGKKRNLDFSLGATTYGISSGLIMGGLQDGAIEFMWLVVCMGSDKGWHGILTQL